MTKKLYNKYYALGFQFFELGEDKKPLLRRIKNGKCTRKSIEYDEDKFYAIVPPKNILIIDVDVKNGKKGLESLKRLEADLLIDLEPMVKTGSGGIHIYVTVDHPIKITQKDYPDIDFIGHKANERLCPSYAVAGGQTISFEDKKYVYEMLHDKIIINKVDDLHEILEIDELTVALDVETISVNDLYEKKNPDEVKRLLSWLDASDYHEWMANASVIRRELGNTKEAFEIFDEWSKTAGNYDSREACLAKWKQVSDYSGQARTVGTLYMQAIENKTMKLISKLKKCETKEDLDELINKDVWTQYPKIPNNVILNEITKSYQMQCQKLDIKITYNEAQKFTKPLYGKDNVNELVVAEVIEDDSIFSDFVRVASFTRAPYFQISNGARHDLEGVSMMLDDALRTVSVKLGLKKPMTVQQAFKKKVIAYAVGHEYNPTTNHRLFIDDNGQPILNLFDPKTVPAPSDYTIEGERLIKKFKRHLVNLTSDVEANILLDWMAYAAQHPGKKILWVPLIQSIEGVGKSLIGNLLINHVFGKANAGVVDSVIIAEKNNSWASSKMLRILEEIKLSGHNRYEVLNQLKPLITNPTITRVEKFEVSNEVRNTCNFIAFTNFKDALPIDEHDRRWWLVFSQIQSLSELEKVTGQKRQDYFEPLHELARPDSAYGSEFRRFLLDRELLKFDPNFPPESIHKEELAEIERSKLTGVDEVQDLIKATYKIDRPTVINFTLLRDASELALNDSGKRITPKGLDPKTIRSVLGKLGYAAVNKKDYGAADWAGVSPFFYNKKLVTLHEAVKVWEKGYNIDFMSDQFFDLDEDFLT